MQSTEQNYNANAPAEAALAELASHMGVPAAALTGEKEIASFPHDGGRFEVSSKGVYWCKGEDTRRRICDELRIEAQTRDRQDRNWGLLLTWQDGDGNRHREEMPIATLHGDSADAAKLLASGGLRIAPGQGSKLREYLLVCQPKERVRSVEQLGWHGGAYCTSEGTIGSANGERIEFQGASGVSADSGRSGTAEEWRDHVAALAAGNSRLVFAIACAFGGPLLHLAGVESGGFHSVGPSSSGKTTKLCIAASVWGSPEREVRTWRATANGLEGIAAVHNDRLLILDELSQCDPKQAGEAAYMLANGKGKARASRTGGAREAATWRLLFLSSGEVPLSVHMESAGKRANAGQEVRLANIPADAGADLGIFEELHGYESPSVFANTLKGASARYYGEAGREFIRRLVNADPRALAETILEGVETFVREVAPRASGQVLRVARRFGLVATAGELATGYGLTGWQEGEADRGCATCFAAWLEGFGVGTHEKRALVEQVLGFIERHGSSRFQKVDAEDTLTINRAGFWREVDGRREGDRIRQYLVTPRAFKSELTAGVDPKWAVRMLQEAGVLVAGSDRLQSKVRLPGLGSRWVYVLVTPEGAA